MYTFTIPRDEFDELRPDKQMIRKLIGKHIGLVGRLKKNMNYYRGNADLVARIYRSASAQIVFSAQDIFEKYMTKHKLSKAEAWRFLNSFQDKDSIQKLLLEIKNKDSGKNKQELLKELEAPAYRARIERLQRLLQQVDTVMQNVYQQEQRFDTSFFEQLAENAYYRTIYNTQRKTGLGFSFSHVDQKQIERALRMNWSGKHYSKRIWKNTDDLAKTIKDELLVSLLTGRTDRETAAVITEKFGGGAIAARRLIRTESCFFASELTAQAYKECGIKKYRYVATLDLRTSKICRELDGEVFLVSERQAGKNYPPMHPWCRSTTISDIDDETLSRMTRAAYNPETGRTEKVPANMTYDEWYQKYVKGNTKDRVGAKSIAKTIDSGIIKKNKDKLKMNLQLFAESDIKNQESGSLKRAIRKYEKRIKEHEEYLENPKAHCSDWDDKMTCEQEGLKRHWKKEIRNFNQAIQDRIDELKERGDYNG